MRRSALAAALFFGVLPTVVITGLTIGQYHTAQKIDRTRAAARHTRDVSDTSGQVELAIEEAERGERGFVLSGDPAALAPYESGRGEAMTALKRLVEFSRQDADLQPLIAPLEAMTTHRLEQLAERVAERQTIALATQEARAAQNLDDSDMRRIIGTLDHIIALETARRERDREGIDQDIIQGNRLDLIAGGVAFAALSIAAFALFGAYRNSRQSEAVLQATLNSVREGVGAFDSADRLIAWNQHFLTLHRVPSGFAKRGVKASALERLERDRPDPIGHDLTELRREAVATGTARLVERKRDDGTIVELLLSPSPDGGFVTSYTDVTDRRRTEALYRQAQRMEALGRMTGGVAHDFNNLLTIVIGNLELLLRRAPVGDTSLRLINQALQGAERGTRLTQQLLAFARRQPLEPRAIDLRALLPDLTELIRKTLGSSIAIDISATADLWSARVDPTQFESALLNLAINARDAMGGSGTLTIEAANTVLDDSTRDDRPDIAAGEYIVVSVTDTGSGMSSETVARAFEPFYTTKKDGDGTGLGLSMVYGFARQSGGHVKIRSALGHGTTMEMFLPRSAASPEESELPPSSDVEHVGTETILVVEDDAEVSAAVVELLGELGYTVLEATDGQSGLDLLNRLPTIDLLFSDVVMPGPLSSRKLAELASELRPDMAILFTSGYTEDEINADGRLDPGIEILPKPYRTEQLAAKIRGALTRRLNPRGGSAPSARAVPALRG